MYVVSPSALTHSLMAAGTSISVVTCRCYGHCIHIGIISTSMALPKKHPPPKKNEFLSSRTDFDWQSEKTLSNTGMFFQSFAVIHVSLSAFSAVIECSVSFLFIASVPLTFLACVSSIAGQAEAEE